MARDEPHERTEPTRRTDEELAREVQAGSSSCFAELVGRYEDRLLRFLVRRTRSVQDAEDLLQETFVRAYRRIDSYDARWKLSTWLFTIASRLAVSHYRRRRHEALEEADRLPGGAGDPSAIVARREEADNLWRLAGEALTPDRYTALWLRYAEGMAVKAIAKVMDKTQTHVKVLLFRARSVLAKRLAAAAPVAAAAERPVAAAEGGG